ncbi:Unknown protein [Striga hermonthica]|uniref:F-box domain-containing protein n=1 Tax=Striga hermonthica TaxID=68872 RepID=A0A9N7NPD1_STRHE|nr:Unknown protein [Striga hermonthica]
MFPPHEPGPSRRRRCSHQRPPPEKKQKQGILRPEDQMNGEKDMINGALSDDLLSNIFDRVPVHDICKAARLVCRRRKIGSTTKLRRNMSPPHEPEPSRRRRRSHQRPPPEKKQKQGILRPEDQMNGEKDINGTLSDDLLSNIFDRVPVHDICKAARLVCRRWYHVTHSHNTYAFLFKKYRAVFLMGTRDSWIETTKLRQQNASVAVTDCSELCLAFAAGGDFTKLILSHHSTEAVLNLPSLVTRSKATPMYSWGVARARDSMDLKVVVYIPPDPYTSVKVDEFHVLTIGDDDESWRVVQAEPRVIDYEVGDGGFTENLGPGYSIGQRGEVKKNTYLSTGKCLSLLRECGELYWEVWEMDPRTFAWRMTGDFSLEAHRRRFESRSKDVSVIPVGWVKYLEVLVLCADLGENTILIYNLVKEEMERMELPCRVCYYSIHPYEV